MNSETWAAVIIATVPGLLALGAGWWRISRLEADMKERATSEKVEAVTQRIDDKCRALERRIDVVDEGVEKKLDKLDEDVRAIRSMMERVVLRFFEGDTSPGRK